MEVSHIVQTLQHINAFKNIPKEIELDGHALDIVHVLAATVKSDIKIILPETVKDLLTENATYLDDVINSGKVIYGVNTGYGGSADVRSSDIIATQKALVQHLNAGFGPTLSNELVRAVMLVRANSLCLGYSGVRPQIVQTLLDLLHNDIIPVVPKRGSVSASGDLMPTSYIAACMMGREDLKVIHKGTEVLALEALKSAQIQPVEFISKEALAVVNAASFASSMGAMLLYDANIAAVLTQAATALSVESLCGHKESFHPTIHQCMPHKGQLEAAKNICHLLTDSKLTLQELDMHRKDEPERLKQDRYALRTSPQWLAPVLETLQNSLKRITIEINSANDNPLVDHKAGEIFHGGNFQGVSITVAMDQARQSLQLCGKLLFAQMSEILNWYYNDGLPPNLSGCDIRTDFGFKGTDTAMASYCSELDYLTGPLTNHVLSAEMHNQAVNSMALVSARMTEQALEILQMMLANIFCAHAQAIDLRWLQLHVNQELQKLVSEHKLEDAYKYENWQWYQFVFNPEDTLGRLYDRHVKNGLTKQMFTEKYSSQITSHLCALKNKCTGPNEVADILGTGTKKLYLYIRQTLDVPFYDGQEAVDSSLNKIYLAIKDRKITDVLLDMFCDFL